MTLCRKDGSPSAFSDALEKVANTSRPVRHECATGAPQVCGAPPPQEQMLNRTGRRVAVSAEDMRVYTARASQPSQSQKSYFSW
jgi:hypothetical protein